MAWSAGVDAGGRNSHSGPGSPRRPAAATPGGAPSTTRSAARTRGALMSAAATSPPLAAAGRARCRARRRAPGRARRPPRRYRPRRGPRARGGAHHFDADRRRGAAVELAGVLLATDVELKLGDHVRRAVLVELAGRRWPMDRTSSSSAGTAAPMSAAARTKVGADQGRRGPRFTPPSGPRPPRTRRLLRRPPSRAPRRSPRSAAAALPYPRR